MRTTSISIVSLAAASVMAAACTARTNVVVAGTPRAAGADGHVEIVREDAGNFLVTVETSNLPPPARLGEDFTVYVVWFQAREQQPMRVGTLTYDEADRTGEMRATTAYTAFSVIVSAEIEAEVAAPSDVVAFRTAVEAPAR